MEIKNSAQAGTFESSDILVMVEPVTKGSGRDIDLTSSVYMHYADSISNVIIKVLDKFKVEDVKILAKDKGALDPTIEARVETAIKRALGIQEGTL
jgi:citrate lyase subunit gamma (acyl carrier protein)